MQPVAAMTLLSQTALHMPILTTSSTTVGSNDRQRNVSHVPKDRMLLVS